MATPRSNSACILKSQEVGKLTFPSFSSCWLHALPFSAVIMRLAAIIGYFSFMVDSPMGNAHTRDRTCTFARQERRHVLWSYMPADGINAARAHETKISAYPVQAAALH